MPKSSPSIPIASEVPAPQPPALLQALGHPLSDRRLLVLSALGECGSISQAARQVGVSYKAAWQALDTLTNLAGVPVVEKSVGGAGGGGARLTVAGHELLRAAQAMTQARGQVLQQLQAVHDSAPVRVAQQLSVRTSMRNQWPCCVQQVRIEGALAQIDLLVLSHSADAADAKLTASITAESAQLLGLQAGQHVLALCKATALQVHAGSMDTGETGLINCWPAKALRVSAGALGDEVAAQTQGGLQLVGFAAARSGLRAGRKLWVHAPASAVVLALA